MLINAMDSFQVAKREHTEKKKAQYLDKNGLEGKKNYFRASEMGADDRKIIYSFFKHQIPHDPLNARSLRIFENGDFVHDRYQSAWEDMGVLISMEERLSSKEDEFLKDYPWEWAGHYDGLLDVNIVRAHALNKVNVSSVFNEDTDEWEIQVELDDAYAQEIGIFDENGDIAEDYEPLTMVADIKTMNPWGFDRVKKKADISDIQGYIDQIQFYMYMLNSPYGSIYIENKANNDVCEVQIIWRDMHEEVEYEFDETIHGKKNDNQIRVVIDTARFFGSETTEGAVQRVDRLWAVKEALEEADTTGDMTAIQRLMPDRCSDKPDSFPCSWSSGRCDFYEHCWNSKHHGMAVREMEEVPAEAIWEFEDEDGNVIKVDNRKVPEGVTYDGFIALVGMDALKLDDFLIEDTTDAEEEQENPEDTAVNGDNIFSDDGELDLADATSGKPKPAEAQEYKAEDGDNAIDCLNCGKQVTYKRLGNGGTKKCPHCKHTNRVVKA